MARTAGEIVSLATSIAKCPGYQSQAASLLNGILGDLCETYDFAVARGLFQFNFNPELTTNFGSGPNILPLDYLRTSGSSGSQGAQRSVWWTLLGVPYPMIPCDLAEFDMQVEQAGLQSYPWLWATDMAVRTIVLSTSGTLVPGNPGTISNLLSVDGIVVGMYVSGPGLLPLTQVTAISGTSVTIVPGPIAGSEAFLPSEGGGFLPSEGGGFLPSEGGPTVVSSLIFGYPGVGYAYPPPSGAYPVTCRYQRDMPDLSVDVNGFLTATAAGQVPWFPNFEYLKTRLAADLMGLTDDSRQPAYDAEAIAILDRYLKMKDDDTNRAKTVNLDRRVFGPAFRSLRNTKVLGW